ncbi:MAG: DUF3368 domain-containing protein [Clostridia bacterium]|nr:DUF3368 domain-containing protein [Clostridia bacterium]
MIVVSDSTPLITLMKAMQLDLLHKLFGEIAIPQAVFSELTSNSSFRDEADLIRNSDYIRVVQVSHPDHVDILCRAAGLDRGESEAIVFADESKADLLLMDEAKGRQVARNMNIPILGSIGILIRAFQAGHLSEQELASSVDRIRHANRHISERLLQQALDIAHGGL